MLVTDMAIHLSAEGHQCDVAVLSGSDTPLLHKLEEAGISVHLLSNGGNVYDPRHILRLRPLIRKYDIVHTHNTASQFFAAFALRRNGPKLVTTEHNTFNRRRNMPWLRPLDRWMYGKYTAIASISAKASTLLAESVSLPLERIATIENGVDLARFSRKYDSVRLAPEGSRTITMVAGFRAVKQQDTLIRALRHLPERFHLVLVGQGMRMEECRRLAESLGLGARVHFLGLRTDIPEILASSDYVAMSSHYEGLSLSSVEGMAAGKPMLASDVMGLQEVVGGAGILFKEEDDMDFAEKLLQLENSPSLYAEVAASCRKRAGLYDFDRMIRRYEELYESCIS